MSPRLTILLIVCDVEEQISGFLASVQGTWDELVVVDTGSTDETPARFAAAGARVVHHGWADDASAVHNVGLAHVQGDWVLLLGADERPSPGFREELRATIEKAETGAVLVRLAQRLTYGHSRDRWALRAWRMDSQIQFERAVCEDVSPAVERMLQLRALRSVRLLAPLLQTRSPDVETTQRDRLLERLRRSLLDEPLDLFAHWKVLELAREWHDERLWRSQAIAAADAFALAGPGCLLQAAWGGALVALVVEGLFAPDSAAGLALLDTWALRIQPSAPFRVRRGFFCEQQGRLLDADRDYEAALVLSTGDALAIGPPHLGLARLALSRGDATTAFRHGERALEANPRDPEALLAVASLTRQLHGSAALERFRRRHAALAPLCPEREWALGEAHLAAREHRAAVSAFRLAAGVPPGGPAALRLAQALLAAGEVAASERLATQLLATQPEAGLGVLLFDLAAGRDTTLELELSAESAHAALKLWVDALLESRQAGLVRAIVEHAPAVGETFPWLSSYLRRKSA